MENNANGFVRSCSVAHSSKIEKQLKARIQQRLSEGWSLEKVATRTVWTMYGHLYTIKGDTLLVKMENGTEEFRSSR